MSKIKIEKGRAIVRARTQRFPAKSIRSQKYNPRQNKVRLFDRGIIYIVMRCL